MHSYKNLTDAMEQLRQDGYDGDFLIEGARARHTGSNREYTADRLKIVEVLRFEGASNPDDMAVLYAIEAETGDRGTIVDAFGTYGDVQTGEFLKNIRQVEPAPLSQ